MYICTQRYCQNNIDFNRIRTRQNNKIFYHSYSKSWILPGGVFSRLMYQINKICNLSPCFVPFSAEFSGRISLEIPQAVFPGTRFAYVFTKVAKQLRKIAFLHFFTFFYIFCVFNEEIKPLTRKLGLRPNI
jgi:hypothetical protein